MTHELKIAPKYFEYVKDWSKPFELRKNDRNYQPGDIVILKEFGIISGIYSGRQAIRKISYVLKNCPEYGLDKDYCIIGFAFEPIADKPQGEWIPVSERLPKTDNENSINSFNVLLWVKNKTHPEREAQIYLGKLRHVDGDDGSGNFWGIKTEPCEWTIWGWSYFSEPEVIAWMPLPEPYKGE